MKSNKLAIYVFFLPTLRDYTKTIQWQVNVGASLKARCYTEDRPSCAHLGFSEEAGLFWFLSRWKQLLSQ